MGVKFLSQASESKSDPKQRPSSWAQRQLPHFTIPGIREKLSKIEILGYLWLMFYKMHDIYEIKVSTHIGNDQKRKKKK